MPRPILKPGDMVRTPSGRTAEIVELLPDGKRDLVYLDGDGGRVSLEPEMLTLVKASRVRPWPSRRAP